MQPRINPEKFYVTAELALLLGRSVRTLESWRRCNVHPELRWQRRGRYVAYSGRDILRFLLDGASPQPKKKRRRR